MNTFDLSKKINSDLILKQCFIGVFPIDLSPKIGKYHSALILNLDDSSLPDSQQGGFYFTTDECEYFDSYGRKPCMKILKYISLNSRKKFI